MFLTPEQNTLRKQLEAIKPSHAAVNVATTLQRAFTLLQKSPVAHRRIVVLSDFTVHSWGNFHLTQLSAIPEHIQLHLIRLGEARRDANLLVEAVIHLRMTEAGKASQNFRLAFVLCAQLFALLACRLACGTFFVDGQLRAGAIG